MVESNDIDNKEEVKKPKKTQSKLIECVVKTPVKIGSNRKELKRGEVIKLSLIHISEPTRPY